MAIPIELLKSTESRALGTVVYGGAGLKKTLAKHTLPGPILDFDFEGGNVSLMPWMRRRRKWNEKDWTDISQETREAALSCIHPDKRSTTIKASGLIDSIWFDNMDPGSYSQFVMLLGNFDESKYNSLSLDSLAELSFDVQTFSKGVSGANDAISTPGLWSPIQERTAIALRRIRNYRDRGVFIYFTGQETIDKDYVNDPRGTKSGQLPPEPFSVKGSVDIPGKMVNVVQHVTDLMFHTKDLNGNAVWVTKPEPITGGAANWETKDRTGRVKEKYIHPNFRPLFQDIYGEEGRNAIYTYAKDLLSKG